MRVCSRQGAAADRTYREVGSLGMGQEPGLLYEWLRQVAQHWGWSQTRLAAEACGGISTNTMLHWKVKGARPGGPTLGAIALGVGVTIDELHAVMRGEAVPIPPRPDQNNRPAVGSNDRRLDRPDQNNGRPAAGSNEERLDRLERQTDLLMDLILELRQQGR